MSAYLAYHTSQARMDDLRRQAEHHRLIPRPDARPARGSTPHRVLRALKLVRPRMITSSSPRSWA
jgi:hypothetical protein